MAVDNGLKDRSPFNQALNPDPAGFYSSGAVSRDGRAVARVNRLALVARAYEPVWRERSVRLLTRGGFDASRELAAMTSWLALAPGDLAVDVGCGSGFYLRALHRAQPLADLHGADVSRPFLAVAAQRLAAADVSATLLLAEASDLPYRDGVVAAIACGGTPNELRNRGAAFAEFARVLRPGGRLWLMASVAGTSWHASLTRKLFGRGGLSIPTAQTLASELEVAGFVPQRLEHRPPLLLGRFHLKAEPATASVA